MSMSEEASDHHASSSGPPERIACKRRRRHGLHFSASSVPVHLEPAPTSKVAHMMKLRGIPLGTPEYHCRAAGFPTTPAFQTISDIAIWPTIVLDLLWGSDGRDSYRGRTQALLQYGMVIHSDCSGKLTPEATLAIMQEAMAMRGAKVPQDTFAMWRASDCSPLCLSVMQKSKQKAVQIFTGMLQKLPLQHQRAIKALRPQRDDNDEVRAEAYCKIDRYLQEHSSELFHRAARAANCVLHPGKACQLSFQDPPGLSEGRRPLTLAIAGTPCRPVTEYSGKKSGCGPARSDMEAWHLWKNDIRCQSFDLIILENSDKFPPDMLRQALPSRYLVKYAVWGAHEQGWPMRRSRVFAVAINQDSLLWLGKPGADLTHDFLEVLASPVAIEGDSFAGLDTPENIIRHKQSLAQLRGFYPASDKAMTLTLSELLPLGYGDCYNSAVQRYKQGCPRLGLGGSFLCDVSQSPGRCRAGPVLPTVARTSHLVSVSVGHSFTPGEIDFAMGWPSIAGKAQESFARACGCTDATAGLSCVDRRSLSGNAMILPQVASWLWYCFGQLGRRAAFERVMPSLCLTARDEASDSEGECDRSLRGVRCNSSSASVAAPSHCGENPGEPL